MTDDEALIQRQLGQEWEREVAVSVIVNLMLRMEPTMNAKHALQQADAMLREAEDARIEDEVRGQREH